jgi:hypothetical protein
VNAMQRVSDVFGKKEFLPRATPVTGYPPPPSSETRSAKSPLTKLPVACLSARYDTRVNGTFSALGCLLNRFDKARVTKYAAIATLPPVKVRAR